MPRHPFKKFTTGEKLAGLPKEVLNAVVEREVGFAPNNSGNIKNFIQNSSIIKVKNESDDPRGRYEILGLSTPIVAPANNEREFKREVTFKGVTPTTADHASKFCILLEPVADGAIGKAVVAGVVQVRLTGADVGWATVTNNDATKLTAGYGGVKVLYAEAGSSERWATVRLGEIGPKTLRGKLDGSLSYQGSATMSVWYWNGSSETDTTNNVTVWDWVLSSGQTIASGKQVVAAWDELSQRFYVISAQCA